MPTYKDEVKKTWYSSFYFEEWTGARKKKKKEGFRTRKEALEFEREFLQARNGDCTMSLDSMVRLYLEDAKHRVRRSTVLNKSNTLKNWVLPYLGDLSLNEITPLRIREWQNMMISKGYAPTTLKGMNNHLSAVFNYAIKYYKLKSNPVRLCGSMGTKGADTMQFLTIDQFNLLAQSLSSNLLYSALFNLLFYTGIRIGEALALTPADFDFDTGMLSITKTCDRINGKTVLTPPKTKKSNRTIKVPERTLKELKAFLGKRYGINRDDLIFCVSKTAILKMLHKHCISCGLPQIRVHDLRHSHASMLIELGFQPIAIADRLGHDNIQTTLGTYSHLYPNSDDKIVSALDSL